MDLYKKIFEAKTQEIIHGVMTIVWVMALIPTIIWWRESILWVAFMSLYANIVGHWSAYQAVKSEVAINEK